MGRIESKEQAEAWLRYIEQSKIPVSQRYVNELKRRAGHKDVDPMDAVVEQMEDMLEDILFGEEDYTIEQIPYDPNDPIQVALRKLDQSLHFGHTYEEMSGEVEFVGLSKIPFISGKPAPVFKQEIMGEFYKEDGSNEEG